MKKSLDILFVGTRDFISFLATLLRFLLQGATIFPLKQRGQAKSIDILGNGPSLKSYVDNGGEVGRVALCVNFSPLTEEFYKIRPAYLMLIDHAFYDKKTEKVQELQKAIAEKVDWDLRIVTSSLHQKDVKEMYQGKKVSYVILPAVLYEPQSATFLTVKHWLFKKGIAMPSAQNVAIAAIFTAMNSGFKDIALYGLEHSWLKDTYVTEDNIVCLRDEHYYGTQSIPWAYNSDGSTWSMQQVMEALRIMFKGYDDLQAYAKYLGAVNIINKTKGSWIDAFERG